MRRIPYRFFGECLLWWRQMNPWFQYFVAVGLIGYSTYGHSIGEPSIYGWIFGGIALVMLLFGGSRSRLGS